MFGIIAAMEKEIDELKKALSDIKVNVIAKRSFYEGMINGKKVVIVKAGIGKVNAGVTTSLLLENYDIDNVINLGIAGGVYNVNPLDIVIGNELSYHDVDAKSIDDVKYGQLPEEISVFKADDGLVKKAIEIAQNEKFNYHVGMIVTGDQFVTDIKRLENINKEYDNILACEMEGAAIAHVCHIYDVKFVVIRVISDVLSNPDQVVQYEYTAKMACNVAYRFVNNFIK